jgi:hypothetical protein
MPHVLRLVTARILNQSQPPILSLNLDTESPFVLRTMGEHPQFGRSSER